MANNTWWRLVRAHFRLGLTNPLAFSQWISESDVRLSPSKRFALFINLTIVDFFSISGHEITLTLHYEALRLGVSDSQVDRNDIAVSYQQPKSAMDVIGISLAF